MSLVLFIASIAATPSSPPVVRPRAEWRICTRQSAVAQLRARPLSLDADSVIQKAFNDCSEQLKAVSRTQSPEDIRQIEEEQSRLIKQDVELFYWDNMTGHI